MAMDKSPRDLNDTIFAPSTAPGRAGLAVLRVSGTSAARAVEQLCGTPPKEPRKVYLTAFHDIQGTLIDRGLVLWFAAPSSFTGEDVAEFHVHGGRAIVGAMLAALSRVPGLRPAERGEFTRRAVENGKLDLTQAEALADLIDAETDAQRRQALRQYDGALGALYENWRSRLIRACALAEATLDFPEEEIPDGTMTGVWQAISDISQQIQEHLSDSRRGEILREGVNLTVFGPPNVGKSSLLNALAKRDVAIVSETAGTTRDVIEVRLDLGGYPVIVADTAGLREAEGPIEAEGVRRALERSKSADIALLLLDASAPDPYFSLPSGEATEADLVVWNKIDVAAAPKHGIGISVETGAGIPALLEAISEKCDNILKLKTNDAPLTRARHRGHLGSALAALIRAQDAPAQELLGEDLRLALRALGQITGKVDVEDILDVVFREFCIGK
jgi:tRNA modification GTPase